MTAKRNPILSKSEALRLAWKSRKDFIDDEKGKGSLYNIWRSKVFTKRGKEIGFSDSWKTYNGFKSDIPDGYKNGLILVRIDHNKPFSVMLQGVITSHLMK